MQNGGGSSSSSGGGRHPLSAVVADCVRRWFEDTLKEAKGGDVNMQVLVSQMYSSGYGVPPDPQKLEHLQGDAPMKCFDVHITGKLWMTRASRTRSSVWRVSGKRPGYNASDSDSESDGLVGSAS